MRPLPLPGLGRRFLRARDWLDIKLPTGCNGLHATWHSEGAYPPIHLAVPPSEPDLVAGAETARAAAE